MHTRLLRTLTAFVAISFAAPAIHAQTPAQLLERYNKAVDPNGVLTTLPGMKSTTTMEAPAMGMSMTINTVANRPNLFLVETVIPDLGTMRQGYDGSTFWSSDPMQGPRLLNGQEAASLAENYSMDALVRSPDKFSAMESAGTVQHEGEAVACVKFTWKSGRTSTDCFSPSTGLIVRSTVSQETQMGEVEVQMSLKDYRAVSGVLIPHRVESSMMNMQMIMTTTAVEFSASPATLFELPAEVKALKP